MHPLEYFSSNRLEMCVYSNLVKSKVMKHYPIFYYKYHNICGKVNREQVSIIRPSSFALRNRSGIDSALWKLKFYECICFLLTLFSNALMPLHLALDRFKWKLKVNDEQQAEIKKGNKNRAHQLHFVWIDVNFAEMKASNGNIIWFEVLVKCAVTSIPINLRNLIKTASQTKSPAM